MAAVKPGLARLIYQWYIYAMLPFLELGKGLSLAEAVYAEFKRRLNSGELLPGEFVDQASLGAELGMSRAPLRDALIRLEIEGFVSIYPRRGVMVRPLDLADIRDLYEILGALEGAAAEHCSDRFSAAHADRMLALLGTMDAALARDDFDAYYTANLAFHDVYLSLSPNGELKRQARISKERLYDFPRRAWFLKDWELSSMEEHRELARRLAAGDFAGAATWVRDVHWSYTVQEAFVRAYYLSAAGPSSSAAKAGLP